MLMPNRWTKRLFQELYELQPECTTSDQQISAEHSESSFLSKRERYNKLFRLTQQICSTISQRSMTGFDAYFNQFENIWEAREFD